MDSHLRMRTGARRGIGFPSLLARFASAQHRWSPLPEPERGWRHLFLRGRRALPGGQAAGHKPVGPASLRCSRARPRTIWGPLVCAQALALLASSLGLGCGQVPGISFEPRTTPPLDTTLTENDIRIYAGIAVAVDAVPLSGGEPADDGTTVSLTTTDANVLAIDPTPTDGVFVIYGVTPGTADVHVYMSGDAVGAIPATVLDQAELP